MAGNMCFGMHVEDTSEEVMGVRSDMEQDEDREVDAFVKSITIDTKPTDTPKQDKSWDKSLFDRLSLRGEVLYCDGIVRDKALFNSLFKPTKERLVQALSLIPNAQFKKSGKKDDLLSALFLNLKNDVNASLGAIAILLSEGVKEPSKEWYQSQLSLHGMSFPKSAPKKNLRQLLERSCLLGETDHVADFEKVAIAALRQREIDERKRKKDEENRHNEECWKTCWDQGTYSQMLQCDPEAFTAKRLLFEWCHDHPEGVLKPSILRYVKREDVYALERLAAQFNLAFGKSDTEYTPQSLHVVIGRDTERVKKECANQEMKTSAIVLQWKRKREQEEEREREYERQEMLKEQRKKDEFNALVKSIRDDARDNKSWDICGKWQVECKEAENYKSGPFEFQIYREPGSRYWLKFDYGFLAGLFNFENKGPVSANKRTLPFRWAARDTGTGEMNYGDDHTGTVTFSDYGTTLKGNSDGAFGYMNFTAVKVQVFGRNAFASCQNEWDRFSDEQYEYERVSRWH